MYQVTKEIATEFCKLCNWVYESWITHKTLFDENEKPDQNINKAEDFAIRLFEITFIYCLLQISKLHDPAIMGSSQNLTINYIVQFGEWGAEMHRIVAIQKILDELGQCLKTARNKVMAHSDLKTIMSSRKHGYFPPGLDDKYFRALQDLVDEVAKKWLGGVYRFNDLARVDAEQFLALLEGV